MIREWLDKTALVMALMIFSGQTYGLASICSAEQTTGDDVETLTHEALWDTYDNWHFNMFVEISSDVEGPASSAERQTFELASGGNVIHYVSNPPEGTYTIGGMLRVGYPLSWGFDAYYDIVCQPVTADVDSSGSTENAPENNDSDTDPAGDQPAAGPANLPSISVAPRNCADNGADDCPDDITAEGVGAERALDRVDLPVSNRPTIVTTGFIETANAEILVLRTNQGRYVTMSMPTREEVTIRRHRFAAADAIREGDVVGLVYENSQDRGEALGEIRVYRDTGAARSDVAATPAVSTIPGVETRRTVQAPPGGGANPGLGLRLGQRESTVELSPRTIIRVVEPAGLTDMRPISGRARAIATRQADGSLVVRTIDILR